VSAVNGSGQKASRLCSDERMIRFQAQTDVRLVDSRSR